jgi:hypothetical protein
MPRLIVKRRLILLCALLVFVAVWFIPIPGTGANGTHELAPV